MSDLLNDRAIRTLRYALDGLSLRQQAIGNNVANLSTPGYKASRVSFEQALQQQIGQGTAPALVTTNAGHMGPSGQTGLQATVTQDPTRSMRLDGNNVDIDWEMAKLAETVVNYNAVSELVSMKLAILKSVISGR
jgi:flagellar basal-body rod protein FlgB